MRSRERQRAQRQLRDVVPYMPNYVDPVLNLSFEGSGLGRWESTGERRDRFTFLQALADAPSHLIHFNGERFLGPYE